MQLSLLTFLVEFLSKLVNSTLRVHEASESERWHRERSSLRRGRELLVVGYCLVSVASYSFSDS